MALRQSIGDGLTMRADSKVMLGARVAKPVDVPERTDIPRGHPLYGMRIVRVVPSGMPDCVVGDDGRLVPAIRELRPIDDIEAREAVTDDLTMR